MICQLMRLCEEKKEQGVGLVLRHVLPAWQRDTACAACVGDAK